MSEQPTEVEHLREMIGLAVAYRGIECCVVEVLEDGPWLVLSTRDRRALQDNQFGEPRREVPETYTVPVWDEGGTGLHRDFLSLGLLDREC
jgi:hypothetical protein